MEKEKKDFDYKDMVDRGGKESTEVGYEERQSPAVPQREFNDEDARYNK